MRIQIKEAEELSNKILQKLGFSREESKLITDTLIDAELCGRKTHGLMRLSTLKSNVEAGKINIKQEKLEIKKKTPVSILIDGKNKPGFYVISWALEYGIKLAKQRGIAAVGCTNTAPASGMISHYARIVTESDLIFIGFNNSVAGLVPFGAVKKLFGTNPLTVGIPTNDLPILLDMSSSKIPWGALLLARAANEKIPEGVAIDLNGNLTTDPNAAMEGGLLPFAEHKGSGLAFIVELLGGALTKSGVGTAIKGGWGSFFILIDPALFRDTKEFKNDIETAIKELKNLPRAEGVTEIFYPGEKSQKLRQAQLKNGEFEISDSLYEQIKMYL